MSEHQHKDRALSVIIRAATPETCGSCKFHYPTDDLRMIECRGLPPTPTVMGQTAQGPAIGLLRPRMGRTEPGCALWKEKQPALPGLSS